MKNIFKIFMVVLLFAGVQYANSADVVKVQRVITPKKQPKIQVENIENLSPQIKSEQKVDIEKQKADNLAKIKQYSTNMAKQHLRMSTKQVLDFSICDFKYKLEALGAKNVNIIDYFEPDIEDLRKENAKINGWTYKPKRCAKVVFDYDNKPYYTIWCN